MTDTATHVVVRWPKSKKRRGAQLDCEIGRDLNIRPSALQDFSATLLTPIEQDLVIVAGAVAYADRMIRRKRASGWARDITLTIPVSTPAFWRKPEIHTALLNVLEYVSGDYWTIEFEKGSSETLATQQTSLKFRRGEHYVVLPFSDGLDSYLQWQLLKKEEPNANILRVHTSSRASNSQRNKAIDGQGDKTDQRLAMPVSLSVGQHAEPSYRTRTFLFFVMAALAAHKFGTRRVVIGENGVGMIGPGMVPFGDECPHRTTHPGFTRRLATFLNRVLDDRIAFEHPQGFLTKGQVLRRALDHGVTGWQRTHSCTRGPRSELDGKPCGVCGGCLLRRTSVFAAGQSDGEYFWDNLSGKTLDDCRSDKRSREKWPSDTDIGNHGIFDMSAFAALADAATPDEVYARAAWEIAEGDGAALAETIKKLKALVHAHANEWKAFREKFSPDGFLNA